MKALEKLKRWEEAYRKHVQAHRDNNPWASQYPEPKPADYGLKSASELFMARSLAEKIAKEKV